MPHPFAKVTLAAAVAALATPVTAQGSCPKTRARHVPESLTFHGAQDCGSIKLSIGSIEVSSPGQGCPLLAIYVPQHEVEATSTAQTRTQVHAQVPAQVFHFRCVQEWYAFVPWGSSCAVDRIVNSGPVLRMTTVPCGGD